MAAEPSRVPERLRPLRDAAREGDPVLIAYGPGVKDGFVAASHHDQDFGSALWEALHDAGFRRIVFFTLDGMLKVRDRGSRDGPAAEPAPEGPGLMANGFTGPLGGQVLEAPPRRDPDPPATAMRDAHALKMLRHLMRDRSRPTAIVFEQQEVITRFVDEQRALASALEDWLAYRPGVRNLCVLVFNREDLDAVADHARHADTLPALRRAVADERARRDRPGMIGPPREEELSRLVQRARLRAGLAVEDWTALPGVVRAMAAQDRPLSRWKNLLEEVLAADGEPLATRTLRARGWISGPQLDGTVWERLDQLRGLAEVKAHLHRLRRVPPPGAEPAARHLVFQGNPGTGKTTVARLVGEILRETGVLRRGHVREVNAGDLVAEHVGGTVPRTNAVIDEALDGVLFLDEAYMLSEQAERGFGKEALDTLLARMENDRDRLVVVAAGYPDDMRRFLAANPGLRDRFPASGHLTFADYDPETLHAIAVDRLAPFHTWDEDFERALAKVLRGVHETRDARFGNARVVRDLVQETADRWADRVGDDRAAPLVPDDLPERHRLFLDPAPPGEGELFGPLDGMIGLASVKDELRGVIAQIRLQRRLGDGDLVAPHLLFLGPPGTGKTTVAREFGRILHRLGLLPKGHLVEAGRKDLVGRHLGETARETAACFERALGGVLFIDEAYALVTSDDGRTDPYGQEAVNAITQHMEDDRGRLSVIAAGYPERMARFLAANEGLRDRFTVHLDFPPYTLPELLEILRSRVAARGFHLGEGTAGRAERTLRRAMAAPDFGNARAVRRIEGQMYAALSRRVMADLDRLSDTELRTYRPEDVPDELR
ncbi:AAA family ATPase [Spirillospora sp. CA-253888]